MQRRSELLKSEADLARERLASSIEELRSRISPSNLLDRVMSEKRQAAVGEFARGAAQRVRENPLPVAAVAGAALIGLFAGGRLSAAPARKDGDGDSAHVPDRAAEPQPLETRPHMAVVAGSEGHGLLRFAIATGAALVATAAVAALLPVNGTGRAQSGKAGEHPMKNADEAAAAATTQADWSAPEIRSPVG
ncbi:DUF3618 domain-containing protein [Methylocystis heyeri]|uniref:DUF3618 domain-containing protein n=1 Tax=Methylocystis heyeri TaxID=391905 RepID=A0A6B8KD95_9HYPH|nr:DUF3618 domain-containing protein [Methylocystis heyeri]QGM46394.1 DUF3618 domain-containing protein [Methylocystis heyeri]